MGKPIILLTDIGSDIDDALCLLAMINHPDINLKAVYTVNGDVHARSCIAKHMLNLAGRGDVVVGTGQSEPIFALTKPYSHYEDAYVDDSFFDEEEMEVNYQLVYYKGEQVGIIDDGLTHLERTLEAGKYIVFSIAPLTNLAVILNRRPELVSNIEHLFIMGARFPLGHLEHNFRYDSTAASDVLALDIPTTIISSDVCSNYRMPFNLNEWPGRLEVSLYVRRMLKALMASRFIDAHRYKMLSNGNLIAFLRENVLISRRAATRISIEQNLEIRAILESIGKPFFYDDAHYDTERFWRKIMKIIETLNNSDYEIKFGPMIAATLSECIPADVAIHDVYIPYIYLHPEKVKTKRMTISCDIEGCTLIGEGEKHDIVVDLDFEHFAEFVRTYVR